MCDGVVCPKSGREFEIISCFRPGCPGIKNIFLVCTFFFDCVVTTVDS